MKNNVLNKKIDIFKVYLRKVSGAEHSLLQTQLLTGPLEHLSFERATSDQSVNGDVFLLADAVAARHGLDVVLRVPITFTKGKRRCR